MLVNKHILPQFAWLRIASKYGTRLYPPKTLVNTFNSKRYSEKNFSNFRLIILIFSKFHLILLSVHIVILQI